MKTEITSRVRCNQKDFRVLSPYSPKTLFKKKKNYETDNKHILLFFMLLLIKHTTTPLTHMRFY